MNPKRPTRALLEQTQDARDGLLNVLVYFYDQLADLQRPQLPDTVPGLKAITLETQGALRAQIGDINGQKGPRACIVAGQSTPLDGNGGVYVWDATSLLADNAGSVVQPTAIGAGIPGRWRRGVTF